MPVFTTLKQILVLCWQERAVAARFGLVPIAVNLALVVIFREDLEPSAASYVAQSLIGLVSVLAFAPFCIAWYRMILFGKDDVARRPLFTLKLPEFKFFGWTILISILLALVSIIGLFAGGGIVVALAALGQAYAVAGGVVLGIGWAAALLMVLSRWSIVLAMVAADQPADLKEAWTISKPYGWSMAAVQLLIFLAAGLLAALALAGVIPELMEASRSKTAPSASTLLALNLVSTIAGAATLWLCSTLFALVYRRIMSDQAAAAPAAAVPAPNPAP
jgi:hypothetical protein